MNTINISREIQILRGIGIILVCIHHALSNMDSSLVNRMALRLTQSDVVFFFLISGFLFESKFDKYRKEPYKFIQSKALQLLLPYLIWSCIPYLGAAIGHYIIGGKVSSLLTEYGFPALTVKQVIVNLFSMQDSYIEHVWFLYALFLLFIIGILFGRKLNHIEFVLIILGVGTLLHHYCDMPYILWMTIKHIPDFFMGRLLYARFERNEKRFGASKTIIPLLIIITITYFVSMFTSDPDEIIGIFVNGYCNYFFRWSFVFVCFYIARMLLHFNRGRILGYLGDYSLDIYLMHTPYIVPLLVTLMNHFSILGFFEIIISVSLGVLIPILISKYCIRKHMMLSYIMLGRKIDK